MEPMLSAVEVQNPNHWTAREFPRGLQFIINIYVLYVCVLVTQSCLTLPLHVQARQSPLFMEFSRQEYWSGLLFPSRGNLPNSGVEPRSPALQADSLPTEPPGKLKKTTNIYYLT